MALFVSAVEKKTFIFFQLTILTAEATNIENQLEAEGSSYIVGLSETTSQQVFRFCVSTATWQKESTEYAHMPDKRWKSIERKVATYLGGERIPVSGRQRGYSADIAHPTLSIEVKDRNSLPDWLFDAMNQAETSRKGEQIPAVILHQKGQKIEDCLTVIRLSSTLEL